MTGNGGDGILGRIDKYLKENMDDHDGGKKDQIHIFNGFDVIRGSQPIRKGNRSGS